MRSKYGAHWGLWFSYNDFNDMRAIIVDHAKMEARAIAAEAENERNFGAADVIEMVRERLEALGEDMSATPPCNYDDAISCAVGKMRERAEDAERERDDLRARAIDTSQGKKEIGELLIAELEGIHPVSETKARCAHHWLDHINGWQKCPKCVSLR